MNATHFCVQYNAAYDVDDGNVESFIVKEVEKIKDQGTTNYYKREKYRCPYCTKLKPRGWAL